jgi:hypothetical protein
LEIVEADVVLTCVTESYIILKVDKLGLVAANEETELKKQDSWQE